MTRPDYAYDDHIPALSSAPIFSKWRELLDANRALFQTDPLHNLSVPGHPMAAAFGRYLARYEPAHVLDIGCGPASHTPTYLSALVGASFTGIDPLLTEPVPPPFARVPGIAEQMPFESGSFDLALAATSLDHMLNLGAALHDIHRVLTPGGLLVAWVRYWPGDEEYDPYAPIAVPVDAHHLYHLDEPWFRTLWETAGFQLTGTRDLNLPKPGAFITLRATA